MKETLQLTHEIITKFVYQVLTKKGKHI